MNGKFVILEGQDRCGKSTLSKTLSNDYFKPGTICHHSNSPPKLNDPAQTLQWEISNYVNLFNRFSSSGASIIADRFHLGSAVYGRKFRNYDKDFDCTTIEQYFDYYDKNSVYLIVITDYADKIMWRNDNLSLESTAAEFNEIRNSFHEEFEKSTIKNKLFINLTDIAGFNNLLPTVLKFLNHE